jgi:glycosyltransferase involved in cell wall biosynthesis
MGEIDTQRAEGYKLARHGILLSSGDSKAMVEALLFAIRERASVNQTAERAREYVIHHYSVDRLARDMEALYEELLEGE